MLDESAAVPGDLPFRGHLFAYRYPVMVCYFVFPVSVLHLLLHERAYRPLHRPRSSRVPLHHEHSLSNSPVSFSLLLEVVLHLAILLQIQQMLLLLHQFHLCDNKPQIPQYPLLQALHLQDLQCQA